MAHRPAAARSAPSLSLTLTGSLSIDFGWHRAVVKATTDTVRGCRHTHWPTRLGRRSGMPSNFAWQGTTSHCSSTVRQSDAQHRKHEVIAKTRCWCAGLREIDVVGATCPAAWIPEELPRGQHLPGRADETSRGMPPWAAAETQARPTVIRLPRGPDVLRHPCGKTREISGDSACALLPGTFPTSCRGA